MNDMSYLREVDWLLDAYKVEEPDMYRRCVPRRYVPPPGYANPKAYATTFMEAELRERGIGTKIASMATNITVVLRHRMMEFGVPTYFVAEELCRAAAATEPPEGTLIDDIKWPMEAMLFVLPERFAAEYSGAPHAPFLAVARCPVGDYGSAVIPDGGTRMLIHSPVFWGTIPMDYCDVIKTSFPVSDLADVVFREVEDGGAWVDACRIGSPTQEQETQCARRMNSLAAKLLMVMSARPELVERGAVVRKRSSKGGRERDELWSPNMIGRQWRARVESQGGQHASPRMHWRRGHFRGVWHGEGKRQHKLVWIEPTLVNAEVAA